MAIINPEDAAGIWLFDESSGDVATDSSENGNDGTINGATRVNGQIGKALSFNGTSDHVVVPDADSLDLEAWTITGWMFINESEGNYAHMLGKRNDGLGQANYCFRTDSTGTSWEAYFNRGGWQGVWAVGAVRKGVWLYMTATYDGTNTMTIYEDAVEIGSGDIGGPPPMGESEVILGGWQNNTSELIDGILDEIGLFNIALSVDDIQNLMDNGLEKATGITAVSPSGKLATTWSEIKK